jgi:hypothetical protein
MEYKITLLKQNTCLFSIVVKVNDTNQITSGGLGEVPSIPVALGPSNP